MRCRYTAAEKAELKARAAGLAQLGCFDTILDFGCAVYVKKTLAALAGLDTEEARWYGYGYGYGYGYYGYGGHGYWG